jgi:hypothetical protein
MKKLNKKRYTSSRGTGSHEQVFDAVQSTWIFIHNLPSTAWIDESYSGGTSYDSSPSYPSDSGSNYYDSGSSDSGSSDSGCDCGGGGCD